MISAPQLLARVLSLPARDDCADRDPFPCWVCGSTWERGIAREAWMGSNFVGQNRVRAEESGARKRRMLRFGESSDSTCAPIGWWRAEDVWAYLFSRHLPVHPAYACMGRLWTRDRIRVASLGGRRGDGMGRTEWERAYYPEAGRMARGTLREA